MSASGIESPCIWVANVIHFIVHRRNKFHIFDRWNGSPGQVATSKQPRIRIGSKDHKMFNQGIRKTNLKEGRGVVQAPLRRRSGKGAPATRTTYNGALTTSYGLEIRLQTMCAQIAVLCVSTLR